MAGYYRLLTERRSKRRGIIMQAIFETMFDIIYLSTVVILGIKMIKGGKNKKQYFLYGTMAVTLGFGDAFHLIPRAVALCTTGLADYTVALGIGKLITSVTMTLFYVILYYVWRERYEIKEQKSLDVTVWVLSAFRVVLSLMPQNEWLSAKPSLLWGIYRNIPFTILGLIVIWCFYNSSKQKNDVSFKNLWLTIVLSFGFYIPVVLFADTIPVIGALMIPKTCAYVWTVLIGYNAMKKEC